MIVSPSTETVASRGSAARTSATRRCGSIGVASDSIDARSFASFSSRAVASSASHAPSALRRRGRRARRPARARGRRVGDHAELDLGAAVELARLDVDLRDPHARREAARAAEAEDPVEAAADHHDRVRALERGASARCS
jgi:hypothetical protein